MSWKNPLINPMFSRFVTLAVFVTFQACGGSCPPASAAIVPSSDAGATVVRCTESPLPQGPASHALERIFTGRCLPETWFSPEILARVSTTQISNIRFQLELQLGRFVRVETRDRELVTVFERGRVPTSCTLDSEQRIVGLWLSPPAESATSLADVLARSQSLPGRSALLITKNGADLAAANADVPLAVGSAFKLLVLDAIQRRIDAGSLSWSQVIRWQDAYRSLPSGQLQDWPTGSSFTIETLATLMIANSDNSASDALVHLVTRAALERASPRNTPFLSTRDLFALKDSAHAERLDQWRAATVSGDVPAKRRLLAEIAQVTLPDVEGYASQPPTPDVEWMFSARELCELLDRVHELSPMRVNPGLADRREWDSIAFKGGSEPGVLNYSHRVTKQDDSYCVVATWNDTSALNDAALSVVVRRAFATLSQNPDSTETQ